MRVSSPVPTRFAPMPVAEYLAARYTYRTLTAWEAFVRDGRVWCNDALCRLDTIVTPGDVVACDLPEDAQPQVNYDYTIVYEDDHLLAIDKPPGLRVHSKGKFALANLIFHVRTLRPRPYPTAAPVNRLDADTSGLVLLALNRPAAQAMTAQFRENQIAKTYLAVVSGTPRPSAGTIDLPIGPVEGAQVPRFWVMGDGKPAVTDYETVRALGPDHALLKLMPRSGRTHQLRVHLAAAGHPLVGDALYTLDDDAYLAWVKRRKPLPGMHGLTRQALHAARLVFLHPVTGRLVRLEAPLPPDLQALAAALEETPSADHGHQSGATG